MTPTLYRAAVAATCVVAVLAPGQARAADPAHDPTVDCSHWYRQSPSQAMVWFGVARAPTSHAAPTLLSVTCTYVNEVGRYTSVNQAEGYVVPTYGAGILGAGNVKVCESAFARYADGHTGTAPERCYYP